MGKIIISRLQGGLGNQLFQVARVRDEDFNHRMYFDTSWYKFQGNKNAFRDLSVTKLLDLKTINLAPIGIGFLKRLSKYSNYIQYLDENSHESDISTAWVRIYDGYWQDYFKYQSGIELVKKSIKPTFDSQQLKLNSKVSKTPNSVAIHVRRGDYLSSKYASTFGVLDNQYYIKALNLLEKKYSNLKLFVFSDSQIDPKVIVGKRNFNLISKKKELDDWHELYLMSLCQHNIIANSTFSWWGAYLNKNKHKVVVYPKIWFKDTQLDSPNIFLKEWKPIPNSFL